MDKKVRADVWEETSFLMVSHFNDFDGDLQKWRNSFYEVWRYQMTWSFAYTIEVNESRSRGVFISVRVRPAFKDSASDMMESLGYRNVEITEEKIGVVETYTLPDDWWDVVVE